MQLKPILLVGLPYDPGVTSDILEMAKQQTKADFPQYHVLMIVSTDFEAPVMEISSWRSLSYQNYASLVKMVDEEAWEALEDWRILYLWGGQEHLYLDNEENYLDGL